MAGLCVALAAAGCGDGGEVALPSPDAGRTPLAQASTTPGAPERTPRPTPTREPEKASGGETAKAASTTTATPTSTPRQAQTPAATPTKAPTKTPTKAPTPAPAPAETPAPKPTATAAPPPTEAVVNNVTLIAAPPVASTGEPVDEQGPFWPWLLIIAGVGGLIAVVRMHAHKQQPATDEQDLPAGPGPEGENGPPAV